MVLTKMKEKAVVYLRTKVKGRWLFAVLGNEDCRIHRVRIINRLALTAVAGGLDKERVGERGQVVLRYE